MTLSVVEAVENDKNCIVAAHVGGNLDKRRSPEPLVLTFLFSR
jgi:hypothetical protein